jgi:hypothetical protein
MKNDKLLQHQLRRLHNLLQLDKAKGASWGTLSTWGIRVCAMINAAINRSLRRYADSLT